MSPLIKFILGTVVVLFVLIIISLIYQIATKGFRGVMSGSLVKRTIAAVNASSKSGVRCTVEVQLLEIIDTGAERVGIDITWRYPGNPRKMSAVLTTGQAKRLAKALKASFT